MWTVQQAQAGMVYVILFTLFAVIVALSIKGLRYYRDSVVTRVLIIVLSGGSAALLYFLAWWTLAAKVYAAHC